MELSGLGLGARRPVRWSLIVGQERDYSGLDQSEGSGSGVHGWI